MCLIDCTDVLNQYEMIDFTEVVADVVFLSIWDRIIDQIKWILVKCGKVDIRLKTDNRASRDMQ